MSDKPSNITAKTVSRETQIGIAFDKLQDTRMALFKAGEHELAAREALKAAESAVLLKYAADPKALGGNEPARNARIRELVMEERKALEEAEAEKRQAQLAFELAGLAVDCLKWQIRNDQAIADLRGHVA